MNEDVQDNRDPNIEDEINSQDIVGENKIQMEKVEEELRLAKTKVEENWNLVLRAKAEAENVRRRSTLDLEKAHKYGIENLAKELLHVVDSLDKGLENSINSDSEQEKAMYEGIQLTHKLLIDILNKFDIKEINPLGEFFDPTKHEALSMQESKDVEPNSVLLVVQKGFSIHDRILRPARVIVAKPNASPTSKVDETA